MAALFVFWAAAQAQPAGVEIARPEIQVDDRWIYGRWIYPRNKTRFPHPSAVYEIRVTHADARVIHGVINRQGGEREGDATWTPEWNNAVGVDGAVFEQSKGLLQFPLAPGRSYPAAWELRSPGNPRFGTVRHERNVKVLDWEEVQVPAGKFRALKVQAEGRYRRLDTLDAAQNTFWYAPEVRRWVKSVYQDSQFVVVEELYFYKVQ